MNFKKSYQQPKTVSMAMQPQSILCASGGPKYIPTGDPAAANSYGD